MPNLFVTPPEYLTAYDVKRCTTEKLEELLCSYGDGVVVEQITHIGGRDWVVIARVEFNDRDEVSDSYGD